MTTARIPHTLRDGPPRTSDAPWPAPAFWSGLEVVATPTPAGTTYTVLSTSGQGTSVTNAPLPFKPAYLSVRTTLDSWRGRSNVVTAC